MRWDSASSSGASFSTAAAIEFLSVLGWVAMGLLRYRWSGVRARDGAEPSTGEGVERAAESTTRSRVRAGGVAPAHPSLQSSAEVQRQLHDEMRATVGAILRPDPA